MSWAALILTALLLQSVVFARFQLAGAKPELVYLLTIVLAFLEGPSSGAVAGFAGGMAQDFLLNQPKGITALTLTLVGYVVAGVLTVATIVLARLSLRVLEQRAEAAFPDEQTESVAQPQPVGN